MSTSTFIETARVINAFPFPKKTVIKRPRFGSMPAKDLKNPGLAISRPKFKHMGTYETEGHWSNGRWIKARGAVGHIQRQARPIIAGAPRERGWTNPWNRVERWYLWKGDKVRLLRGPKSDKFNDPEAGLKSGYKIYTIEDVQMDKNRVLLSELKNTRSATSLPKPANWNSLTSLEQNQWQEKNTISTPLRPVQFSNVSLLVEEHPSDPALHIWATRMKTTGAKFDRVEQEWTWDRYAVAITGTAQPTRIERETNGYKIDWPEGEGRKYGPVEEFDTEEKIATESTLLPMNSNDLTDYSVVFPTSINSPPPTSQVVSDHYLGREFGAQGEDVIVDTLMPLYLSEELGPRFTRAKKGVQWKARAQRRVLEKQEYIDAAVRQWRNQGRDRYLREIMDQPEVNLHGVPIRPRSKKEIEEASALEFEQRQASILKTVATKMKLGYLYDYESGRWKAGPKALKRHRKLSAKRAAHKRRLTLLDRIRLRPAKNMVVPQEIRYTGPDRLVIRKKKPLQDRKSEKSRKVLKKQKREERRSWANVRRLNGVSL